MHLAALTVLSLEGLSFNPGSNDNMTTKVLLQSQGLPQNGVF